MAVYIETKAFYTEAMAVYIPLLATDIAFSETNTSLSDIDIPLLASDTSFLQIDTALSGTDIALLSVDGTLCDSIVPICITSIRDLSHALNHSRAHLFNTFMNSLCSVVMLAESFLSIRLLFESNSEYSFIDRSRIKDLSDDRHVCASTRRYSTVFYSFISLTA